LKKIVGAELQRKEIALVGSKKIVKYRLYSPFTYDLDSGWWNTIETAIMWFERKSGLKFLQEYEGYYFFGAGEISPYDLRKFIKQFLERKKREKRNYEIEEMVKRIRKILKVFPTFPDTILPLDSDKLKFAQLLCLVYNSPMNRELKKMLEIPDLPQNIKNSIYKKVLLADVVKKSKKGLYKVTMKQNNRVLACFPAKIDGDVIKLYRNTSEIDVKTSKEAEKITNLFIDVVFNFLVRKI